MVQSQTYDIKLSENGHQWFVTDKSTGEIEKVFYTELKAQEYVIKAEMSKSMEKRKLEKLAKKD